MGWWDDLTTRAGDALLQPQTFGGLAPMPTDPAQRQAMIGPALLTLGAGLFQGARQGQGPLEAFSSAYGGLQQQGAQQAQQRLQGMLLGSKIGEQRKRNETKERLKKNPPAGMTPEMIDVLSDEQIGKLWMDSITRDRARSTMSIGDFPGMSGGPAAAPAGGGSPVAPTGDPVLDAIARSESGGRMVTNPTSGATGTFQFMPATWRDLVKNNPGAGLTPEGINDPQQQQVAARIFRDQINKSFGGTATPGQTYLGWFLGPQGAVQLSRMDPATPIDQAITQIFGPDMGRKVFEQNRPMFEGVRTAGDLVRGMDRRMAGVAPQAPAGGDGAVVPAQYTPPGQGAPAAPAAPAIDYRSDPVMQDAFRAAQRARKAGDDKAWNDALRRGAERKAELEKQARERSDRAGQVVELEDGKWLVDPRTGEKIKRIGDRPTPRGEGREFTEEDQLRKEYTTQVKPFQEVRTHFQRIQAAYEKPSSAGDIAMVYGFMKMLDPTSVVREGEFATASNAGGVDDRIRTVYNKIINGERLTPEVRKDFMDRAARIFDRSYGEYEAIRRTFRSLAEAYGRNPDRVTPDFSAGVKRPKIGDDVPAAGGNVPPPEAIELLRKMPGLKKQFDEKYGPGSADRYLKGAR